MSRDYLLLNSCLAFLALGFTPSCGGGGGGSDSSPTYTVTYDGNGNTGGSVPNDSTSYEQGQTVVVPGNTGNLVKTGHSFAGWNTQADGNGTTYNPSETFIMGASTLTMYAKWTLNWHSLGGTVSGLAGTGLVLRNNGGDDLLISGNGPFTFTTRVSSAASYSVTVQVPPVSPAQLCTVSNGNGTVAEEDVANVTVACIGEGDLVVNELMIDPSALADGVGEWIEIYNTTSNSLDLDGCVLSDDGTDSHSINSQVVVPAGGSVSLAASASPGFIPSYVYTPAEFQLGNSGDEVILTCGAIVIDRVAYTGTFDAIGTSKELSTNHRSTILNDILTNWCNATDTYGGGDLGTPGSVNSCAM